VNPPRLVPVTVVSIVVRIPVVVVTVVVVPEERLPGTPVDRVVTPVPTGAPYDVAWTVDKPDDRPGCYLIVGGGDNGHILPLDGPSFVTGIRRLSIVWFNNVIPSVKSFVTDKLYLDLAVTKLLNGEYCHILELVAVKHRTDYYCVDIAVDIIGHSQIIYITIVVQVKVVDPGVLFVKASFKGLKSL